MNEIQLYSIIMFFAGVGLTHAVFYFDRKIKERKFYIFMSSVILQALDNINLVHEASLEFVRDETKTVDDFVAQEYLEKESLKVSTFMELYVLLFTKSVPLPGRKFINYKSWPEAKALIKELRGLTNNGQSKR